MRFPLVCRSGKAKDPCSTVKRNLNHHLLLERARFVEPQLVSDQELEAYLDEALPAERMAAIEASLREHPALVERLRAILTQRENGIHSVSEIWRRYRISCPSRETLGAYLLDALSAGEASFVQIHLEVVECPFCLANIADLRNTADLQSVSRKESQEAEAEKRRRKYFQSSVTHLPPRPRP